MNINEKYYIALCDFGIIDFSWVMYMELKIHSLIISKGLHQ